MDNNQAIKYYGVYSLAYGTAPEYKELVFQLGRLYRDRVLELPWLPDNWGAVVLPAMTGNTPFYMIAPSTATWTTGGTSGRGVDFLDTPEKKKVWDEISKTATKIQQDYAAKRVAEGRKEMEEAYNNTAFWNSAVNIANLVAAPVNTLIDASEFYAKYRGVISAAIVIGVLGYGAHMFTRRK